MELEITESSDISVSCTEDNEDSEILREEMTTLTTEINDGEKGTTCTATITSVSVRRVRVVVSFVGKLVLPAVVGVYYAYLRNKHTLREVLPAVIAFLTNGIARSLSSVQGAVTNPTNKIDPILRVIKLRYRSIPNTKTPIHKSIESKSESVINDSTSNQRIETLTISPKKCVTCTVLCAPPNDEPIRADIIFVHGLHGSLCKTWRQGDWKMPKEREESVELQRRASTSCLQNSSYTKQYQSLKRSASTNSGETRIRNKIARDDFSDTVFCDCEDALCPICCQLSPSTSPSQNGEIAISDDSKSPCWPRDWLPVDCPGVRVIGITYTTDPYLWRPVWIKEQIRSNMEARSDEMMKELLKINVGQHPIVWVGHSKGGLFVKQILIDAWERKDKEPLLADLCLKTKSIMFYSVPHRGSSLADFKLPFVRRSVELLEIGKDCLKVLDLHQKFLNIFKDTRFNPEVFSFIETSLTFMAFVYLRIVTYDSADPGVGETFGVPLDHREICKPRSRDCFLYQELVDLILRST